MNPRVEALMARLDQLEPKERVLLTLATLVVIGMLWVSMFLDPLNAERQTLQSQINATQARIEQQQQLSVQIVEASLQDPNRVLREQLATTETDIATARSQITEAVGQLIPPQQMSLILRSVLEQTGNLEFTGLVGLGAQPLRETPDNGADTDEPAQVNAYRHGFRISFKGSYLSTLAYLQALEQLPWRFFWDTVDIEVEDHPRAQVSVTVYTLSMERRWIGV